MDAQTLIKIREFYDLSPTEMSLICGFGVNTWRNYEKGAPPNKSNATLISLVRNPVSFRKLLDLLTDEKREQLGSKYRKLIEFTDMHCSQINGVAESLLQQIGNQYIDIVKKGATNITMRIGMYP